MLVPVLLFSLAAACDLLVQRTEPLPLFNQLALVARGVRFGLFVGAFAFFFGRRMRLVYLPLWAWFSIVLLLEAVANYNFSTVLDGCWLMILAASSWQEIVEFLRLLSPSLLWASGALSLVALMGGLWGLSRKIYPRVSWRLVLLGVVLTLPFVLYDLGPRTRLGAFDALIAFHLPLDTARHHRIYGKVAEAALHPKFPSRLQLAVERQVAPLGLVVVGESATRSNWGLYGYERPTTPRLVDLRNELVVFSKPTSTHDYTSMALTTTLTEATTEDTGDVRCMFTQKCAAVGYVCSLFSAQTRWGRWEGVEKFLFSGCSEKWYLNESRGGGEADPGFDDALVSPVLDRLRQAAKTEPTIVFAHLMGSHFEPSSHYPAARAIFPRYSGDYPPGMDETSKPWNITACNHYDNSIAFTDSVLGDLLEGLRALKRSAYLVYFSDHGESPRGRTWRDSQDPDLLKVPLVVWFSPEYRAQFPQVVADIRKRAASPIRLDDLQSVLLKLARIDQGPWN